MLGERFGIPSRRGGPVDHRRGLGRGQETIGKLPTSGQAHDELVETNAPYDRWPHLPLSGRWFLNGNVYVVDGYDDPLESELDSIFVGGGIRWTDDNLEDLLGAVPLGGL